MLNEKRLWIYLNENYKARQGQQTGKRVAISEAVKLSIKLGIRSDKRNKTPASCRGWTWKLWVDCLLKTFGPHSFIDEGISCQLSIPAFTGVFSRQSVLAVITSFSWYLLHFHLLVSLIHQHYSSCHCF